MNPRRAAPLLLVLAHAGCMRVPVMPSAHSLMRGQNESSYFLQASKFTIDTQAFGGNAPMSEGQWNVVVGGDRRFGLPIRGAEFGLALDSGLNLSGDVKYQLGIAPDPRTPAFAVDAAAAVNPFGPEFGVAVLASKALKRGHVSASLRGTHQRFAFRGKSWFPGHEAKYGYTEGSNAATFVDAGVTWDFDRSFGRFLVAANLRVPIARGAGDPAFAVTDFGPALTLSVSMVTKRFVPYAGSHYAAPRTHVLAYTPYGDWSAKQHMELGKRLFNAGMYLDARDEFNAALLAEPKTTEAYRWIGRCYQELKEPELAYANFVVALRHSPRDDDLKALVKSAKAKAASAK